MRIISDRNSRRSKGIAYVEFTDRSAVPLVSFCMKEMSIHRSGVKCSNVAEVDSTKKNNKTNLKLTFFLIATWLLNSSKW